MNLFCLITLDFFLLPAEGFSGIYKKTRQSADRDLFCFAALNEKTSILSVTLKSRYLTSIRLLRTGPTLFFVKSFRFHLRIQNRKSIYSRSNKGLIVRLNKSDFLVISTSGCHSHERKLEKSLICSQVQLIPYRSEKKYRFPLIRPP